MTYQEMMENAKLSMGIYCKACPVCDGRACKNQIPGPGAKGVGDTAIRNYKKWQEIRVNMDTICDGGEADTSVNLFGKEFKMPFFAGPVGAVISLCRCRNRRIYRRWSECKGNGGCNGGNP